jgi:hypothetical protein
VWEPRVARVVRAWSSIEWLSVAEGVRECALLWIAPDVLPSFISMWQSARLSAIRLNTPDTHFGGSSVGFPTSASGLICVAVGAPDRIELLRRGWIAGDNERLGALLGYPPCCRSFFHDVWVVQGCLDTTWAMAKNTSPIQGDDMVTIELPDNVPPLANILWRWLGVRAVPHLPCRLDCSHSISFAQQLLAVGHKAGFAEEVEWISEIVTWPVEWSALHGIAEIKSPLMKISTRTDATAGKCTVQWVGRRYPKEGAVGLKFPYQAPKRPMLTRSRSYQRGLAHGARDEVVPTWRYADNGFSSEAAMHALHEPIVKLARRALAYESGNVLDLGCGNGMLLAKVCGGRSDLVPYGVDSNGVALDNARRLLAQYAGNFVRGDLFDTDVWDTGNRRYALALLMLGRLLEVPLERRTRVLDRLQSSSLLVLGYAYPDSGEEPLAAMAKQLGLKVEENCGTAGYLRELKVN